MGWKHNQRRLAVGGLRKAARGCGVPKEGEGGWGTVGNDAGRRVVQALAEACAMGALPELVVLSLYANKLEGACLCSTRPTHDTEFKRIPLFAQDPFPQSWGSW